MNPKSSRETLQATADGSGTGFENRSPRRVTHLMVTKNSARQLEKSLDMVKPYLNEHDEVIVVDGASTDDTVGVVSKHGDLVDTFISESDVSAAHAVNKGILLAHGRYVRLYAVDDITDMEVLGRAIDIMDGNPNVDVLVCGGTKIVGDTAVEVWLPHGTRYGDSLKSIFDHGGCGSGFIVRRSSIARIGLFPTGPAADVGLLIQAVARGGIVRFCRLKLYTHEINEQSYGVRLSAQHREHMMDLRRYYGGGLWFYLRFVYFAPARSKIWSAITKFLDRVLPKALAGFFRRSKRWLLRANNRSSVMIPTGVDQAQRWDGGFS